MSWRMRSLRWSASSAWRRQPSWGGSRGPLSLVAARHLRTSVSRRDNVANKFRDAVGIEGPVHGSAETRDHQPLRRNDDHILPHRALGEEGVARPAVFDPVSRAKAVAKIGPESGTIAHESVRRGRRRILYP